ncbi:MAG: hypothetical protein LBD94_02715, partial [Rickettsiales bacterium]|nr:hypothetical protein [Rickettsiales bacterium]
MKKIFIFALSAFLIVPAFAEAEKAMGEVNSAETTSELGAVADPIKLVGPMDSVGNDDEFANFDEIVGKGDGNYAPEYNQAGDQSSKPWWRGWEIGVGVPLVLPATGYNGFIGYMNKKADSWLGRRFGARFDFQIPNALGADAVLKDNGNGYDVDVAGEVLFWKPKFDGVATVDQVKFDIDDDNTDDIIDLNGAKAKFALKNQFIGGMIDLYPFGDTWFLGGLRLSGGYYTGRMDVGLNVNIPNDFPNGGYKYNIGSGSDKVVAKVKSGSRIAADVKWKYSGPYAGLGFDLGVFRGFKFFMDAGVVFAKPPKVSRSNLTMPVFQACYEISGNCDGWVNFDMNKKPIAKDLTKDILGQVIKANVEGAFGGSDFADIKDKIIAQYGGNPNIDYGSVANDIMNFLDYSGNTNSYKAANPTHWITELLNKAGDAADVSDALDEIKKEWNNPSSDFNSTDLQQQIDDAWNDYEKGIDDINKSLKDMRFMPIIKIGV